MMKRYLLILAMIGSSQLWAQAPQANASAADTGAPAQVAAPVEMPELERLRLADPNIDRLDMASVRRGAKFFATTCNTCHALNYLQYDPIVKEAGIVFNRVPPPMPVPPPDLSLEANYRGVNWIYTYLHSFYQDPKTSTGYNNLIFPNTSMPDVVGPFQGEQELVATAEPDLFGYYEWYDWVKLTKPGTMTSEEFDAAMADVVNFLAYAAEPYHAEQTHIGYWVLAFLALMFVLMYLLKKEYWRDVYDHKE